MVRVDSVGGRVRVSETEKGEREGREEELGSMDILCLQPPN